MQLILTQSYIHKCFSTETEIITEFSEPITVEITEVCFIFLAAVKFFFSGFVETYQIIVTFCPW